MNKPSPAQAILMRSMSIDGAHARAELNKKGEILEVFPYGFNARILPNTFSACLKNGWIDKIVEEKESFGGYKYTNVNYVISEIGKQVLSMLSEDDFVLQRPNMTAKDVLDLLHRRYKEPEWLLIPEMRMGTGYGGYREKRLDAWAINTYPSTGHTKIAFEIKVYRSDFLKEISNPEKRIPGMTVSDYFYLVTLEDVAKPEEIPDDCGWIIVKDKAYTKKKAPLHNCEAPNWSFIASLFRRVDPLRGEE